MITRQMIVLSLWTEPVTKFNKMVNEWIMAIEALGGEILFLQFEDTKTKGIGEDCPDRPHFISAVVEGRLRQLVAYKLPGDKTEELDAFVPPTKVAIEKDINDWRRLCAKAGEDLEREDRPSSYRSLSSFHNASVRVPDVAAVHNSSVGNEDLMRYVHSPNR